MPANPFQDTSIISFFDIGAETQVNVETASNQQNASIAFLSNTNFVVTWESNLQDGSGIGVYARLFAPDGTPLTGDLQMNVTTANNQNNPEVIALDNGRAMVVWNSGGDIWYRLIEADGTSPAGEFQINSTTSASNFEIAEFASGNFMVTWESSDGAGMSSGVYGQRLSFNGTEVFNEFRINDGTVGAQRRADTAELQSGTVFTVFQSQAQVGTPSDQGVYLRNYSNTSTLAGSDIAVADAVGEFEALPQIEALDGGGFAVAWVNTTTGVLWAQTFINTGAAVAPSLTNISGAVGVNTLFAPVLQSLPGDRYVVVWEDSAGFGKDLYYRVLEADGTTVTTGLVHTNTTSAQSEAQVHVLPQGGFITVYAGGPGSEVFIVRHTEDGTPAGPMMQVEYPVNTTTSNLQNFPDVAVNADGEIIVTWNSAAQDGSGIGVYMQRFASPEIGTTGNDNIIGDGAANYLAGWNGDDTLKGKGDNDHLDGGDGEDQLIGGGGEDTLLGGQDDDQLAGGNDNDTVDGGHGADLLFGNGGNDSMLGQGGDDTIFGGTGADDISGGANQDQISGQGGADTIKGDEGVDILRGGSGDDSIEGGEGNDSLFGNGNNDTLRGGDGDDSIQGNAGADRLFGDAGDDTLFSGAGGDRLDGGSGNDLMNGGIADGVRDVFTFMVGYDEDRINQFDQAGTDLLELDDDLWAATPTLTKQQVIDTYGTLNGNSTILTLDFGGSDILEVQNSGGINQATLGADVLVI